MKRVIASRRIVRGNVGFTLAELLVATFLGLVVVTSIYLVLIGSSQQYALQQQIVAAQEHKRYGKQNCGVDQEKQDQKALWILW